MEYVVGFMFSPDDYKVVLIEKQRPDWQAGLLNGPGGKVESGETPLEAMEREFSEEAGTVRHEPWETFASITGDFGTVYFFRCYGDVHEAATMTDEEITVLSVATALSLPVVPSLEWLLPMARDRSVRRCTVRHSTS